MNKTKKIFSILTVALTFISVNQWSRIPLGNQWTTWIIQMSFICMLVIYRNYLCPLNNYSKILRIYLAWLLFDIVRGICIAENYWEWKQLIGNSICLMLPLFLWLFCIPSITANIYRNWIRYAIPAFLIFFVWLVGITQFYLSPLLLLFCFWPIFKKKYAFLLFLSCLIYMFANEEARAQTIKGGMALLMGIASLIVYKLNPILIRVGHVLGYLCTLVLFLVILSDASGLILGKMTEDEAIENNKKRTSNEKDTRSLIYYDVYMSSINHDYWLCGHTPARGNEVGMSWVLFREMYEEVKFNKNERYRNEMLHLNIYTWLGLIGLIIYSMFYFRASYLAVYKSKNRYISLLGCFIAFRWSFAWIEDTNTFMISDISLWTMLGMCFSPYFRNMSKVEFENWIRGLLIFKNKI